MKVTEYLLDSVKDIWEEYHAHPFVLGIADGTLDKEKFRYYIIQDYLYLIDYAKVNKEKRFNLIRQFLPAIDNWAICDNFCCNSAWVEKADKEN